MKITRPQASQQKIHSKDQFELCYVRHQYFRRVNYNPSQEEMKPYSRIIESLSRNTFYTYRYLFATIGMELDDIINVGHIHLVSFLGLFEINETQNRNKYEDFCVAFMNKHKDKMPIDSDLLDKNKANFTMFLKQRMDDLVRICRQKAKNIKGLQVDEYIPFYGPNPPPNDVYLLLDDNQAYGFKKLDHVAFKAIKKRTKADIKKPFQFAASWYVAVFLEPRNLTELDLSGAGLDPHNNFHNMDPERLLLNKQQEIKFDKQYKVFKNSPKEEKVKTIFDFIEKNEDNPKFEEEIVIAKRLLKNMGAEYDQNIKCR
jgi:hypothetical protein